MNLSSIPKSYYIGIHDEGQGLNTSTFPLAFATPDGHDSAAKKRKETVDRWSSHYERRPTGKMNKNYPTIPEYESIHHKGYTGTFENDWLEGFTFDKVVSRYSTDNKVFRIQDPRGFTLEIYSDNLAEILIYGAIEQSVIKGKCCWAKSSNGKVYLLMENSPSYKDYLELQEKKDSQSKSEIKIGSLIDSHQVYLGEFYAIKLDYKYTYSYGSYRFGSSTKHQYNVEIKPSKVEKPWIILGYKNKDSSSAVYLDFIRTMRKNSTVNGECTSDILEYNKNLIKYDKFFKTHGSVIKIYKNKDEFLVDLQKQFDTNWSEYKEYIKNQFDGHEVNFTN